MADEVVVSPLFTGEDYKTQVWISKRAMKAFWSHGGVGRFDQKLERYAEKTFENWIGAGRPIQRRESGVFRIGHKTTTFRLFGFFGESADEFIIVEDWFGKPGGNNPRGEREALKRAVAIKENDLWRKDNDGA